MKWSYFQRYSNSLLNYFSIDFTLCFNLHFIYKMFYYKKKSNQKILIIKRNHELPESSNNKKKAMFPLRNKPINLNLSNAKPEGWHFFINKIYIQQHQHTIPMIWCKKWRSFSLCHFDFYIYSTLALLGGHRYALSMRLRYNNF